MAGGSNVSHLYTGSTSLTVKQALDDARTRQDVYPLSDVLIVGYDEDGELYVRSSAMTRQEATYLLLLALDNARGLTDGS